MSKSLRRFPTGSHKQRLWRESVSWLNPVFVEFRETSLASIRRLADKQTDDELERSSTSSELESNYHLISYHYSYQVCSLDYPIYP